MRRVGLVLVGLGACLIVFALLIPTWVSGQVVKFPLNEYASVNLTDSNASYFSPAKLAEQTGVSVEATYTIKGNAAAGSSSTAVWNQFVYVYDQTNKLPIQQTSRTFAFDRRTALLVDCCGANVNGDSSVKQSGYVGIVMPIGTEKKTYPVFVPDVKKPVPFDYAGIDAVGGTEAYRFVANIPPDPERHPDPARLAGGPERGVGHATAVLRGADHLLDRPGHGRAAQRHREGEADPQGLHRCPGPAALQR